MRSYDGSRRTRPPLRRVALAGFALLAATLALPQSAAAATETGPSGGGLSAVIRYTENGIPHILARDYAHLGFGTGWAQAADQVCVLADGFVTVAGERSRWFGPTAAPDGSLSSAADNLSSDLYFKGVRESGTVERLLATPAPAGPSKDLKELMRGWAAGYNAWLAQNKVGDRACKGAGWVRPITAGDVAARGFAVSVLGGQGRAVDGITSAQPPGSPAGLAAAPQDPDPAAAAEAARTFFDTTRYDMGSNAVAFAGSTTKSGGGLLLGNPHYPWQGGRRFWQSQQTIPGELNVSGGSLLGTTVVNIGFNEKVAWSHTVATGTPLNLHQLTLDPADPTAYLVDGKSEKMTRRTVTVPVAGGEPVTRGQWWTRYGPVVSNLGAGLPLPWTAGTAYALNDPNAANLRGSDTALAMGRARSVAGIQDALKRTQGLPWVNTVAADSAGGTLFTQSQVLPRITDELAARCSTPIGRATYPASGLAVLDGSRGDCAPGSDPDAVQPGVFGPGRAPTLRDAPYVENSNDSAWLANADRPLTGYERVWGNVSTPRSLRTRGAVEDVAAMAAKGRLTRGRPPGAAVREPGSGRWPGGRRRGDGLRGAARRYGDGQRRRRGGRVGGLRGAGGLGPYDRQLQPGRAALRPVLAEADGDDGGQGPVAGAVLRGRSRPHAAHAQPGGARARAGPRGRRRRAEGGRDRAGRPAGRAPVRGPRRAEAARGRRYRVARRLEQDRGAVERGGRRLSRGPARIQPHSGGRLGRRPLPGGAHPADVRPVLERGLAVLRGPDPAVLAGALGDLAVLRAGHPRLAAAEGGVAARASLTR